MSQEIYRLKINGETFWRACNTTGDTFSLDDRNLEPPLPSLGQAVDRLLARESFSSTEKKLEERERLMAGYAEIESYLRGRQDVDLDKFFSAVEHVSDPDVSKAIGLSPEQARLLVGMAQVIRLELGGVAEWRKIVSDLEPLYTADEDGLYMLLFPETDSDGRSVSHPAIRLDEAPALERGYAYFVMLMWSVDLQG